MNTEIKNDAHWSLPNGKLSVWHFVIKGMTLCGKKMSERDVRSADATPTEVCSRCEERLASRNKTVAPQVKKLPISTSQFSLFEIIPERKIDLMFLRNSITGSEHVLLRNQLVESMQSELHRVGKICKGCGIRETKKPNGKFCEECLKSHLGSKKKVGKPAPQLAADAEAISTKLTVAL